MVGPCVRDRFPVYGPARSSGAGGCQPAPSTNDSRRYVVAAFETARTHSGRRDATGEALIATPDGPVPVNSGKVRAWHPGPVARVVRPPQPEATLIFDGWRPRSPSATHRALQLFLRLGPRLTSGRSATDAMTSQERKSTPSAAGGIFSPIEGGQKILPRNHPDSLRQVHLVLLSVAVWHGCHVKVCSLLSRKFVRSQQPADCALSGDCPSQSVQPAPTGSCQQA